MKHIPKKTTFLEVALQIERFHLEQLKDNPKWKANDTARITCRSIAAISKYLKVASWNRTHAREIEQCDGLNDALRLIEKLDRERKLKGLE